MNAMLATLYIPGHSPQVVPVDGLRLPDATTGYAYVTEREAELLGCARGLVDVMDCSPDYVAYTIFDYEGDDVNLAATQALSRVSTHDFDLNDEEEHLRGPVLLVTRT
jgi:hypothetical protein